MANVAHVAAPQSSVAFHSAVFVVVLRRSEHKQLMFGVMPQENPGGSGAEPLRSTGRRIENFQIFESALLPIY